MTADVYLARRIQALSALASVWALLAFLLAPRIGVLLLAAVALVLFGIATTWARPGARS